MGNTATGIGVALAGLLGFGDLVNPINKKKEQLSQLQADIQGLVNLNFIQSLKDITKTETDLVQLIRIREKEMNDFIAYNNAILWGAVEQNSLLIIFLFILIFIIIFYILSK